MLKLIVLSSALVLLLLVTESETSRPQSYLGQFLARNKREQQAITSPKGPAENKTAEVECSRREEEDHDDEEEDERKGKTTNIIRVITMTFIFLLGMIFGLLPLKTLSMKYRSRIASIANCFGGGVFFGTCFLHLIPEVKMQITEYVDTLADNFKAANPCLKAPAYMEFLEKLPIPEFLECSGFLLILSIEKIAESAKKIRPLTQRFSVFISTNKLQAARALVKMQTDLEDIPDGCEGDHSVKSGCDDCPPDSDTEKSDRRASDSSIKSTTSSTEASKSKGLPAAFLNAMKGNLYNKIPNMGPEHAHDPAVSGDIKKKSVGLLIMALSIHSFFEGLAIGVESTASVFLQLAAAITVHKCVIAFAVGSRLIHSGKSIGDIVMCLGCMCIMTPIGVSFAMIIVSSLQGQTVLIVSGTIQGISTGFFLYITFAEMLFQEMKSKQDSFLKVSFMTVGVLLVTASTIWHNWNGAHEGH